MQVHTVQPNQWMQYVIPVAIVLVVLALRISRMGRARRLRLETLWIIPALYLVIAAGLLYEHPPVGMGWAYCGLALLVGSFVGWHRGKAMHISVDPETHALNQKASPAAIIFLVVIILIRQGAQMLAAANPGLHAYTVLISDALVAFALGMFAVQRLEMFLRAKRLLEEARGSRTA